MIIYLDESYDNNKKYFILGALFNPHHKPLLKEIKIIKNNENFFNDDGTFKEIKYNDCLCKKNYRVASIMIDSFMQSTSYFRAIVIDTSRLDLNNFGSYKEPNKIKWARIYKKFSEMLIRYNSAKVYNGVLLTDGLSRCNGDLFIDKMKEEFCQPKIKDDNGSLMPILKDIHDIKSDIESYQVSQLNDVLIGCILNNLVPSQNKWKNRLRSYLLSKILVPNLLPSFWEQYPKYILEKKYAKYNIWFWKPIQKKT